MARLFGSRGCVIDQAADGLEAIAKYEASLKLHRHLNGIEGRGGGGGEGGEGQVIFSSTSSELSYSPSKDNDDDDDDDDDSKYCYYDLILMDFEMPNMNGPKATKYVLSCCLYCTVLYP